MNQRIKAIRKSLGVSQDAFSLKLGLDRSYLSQLETGRRELNKRMINLICSVFDVNRVWFETGTGEMFNPPETSEADSTQVVVNYIKSVLSELNEPNRQIVLEAVRQLKEGKNFSDPSIQSGPD